jgi:Holliday junction resolvase-like predicted endonuclease
MRLICFLLPVFFLLTTGCQRKLSATEVKNNLEKAMAAYLHQHQHINTPPLRFDMIDVTYQETDSNYQCRFTIKLYRPDGTDTTGVISSKVSKDFSTVSAK